MTTAKRGGGGKSLLPLFLRSSMARYNVTENNKTKGEKK